ncbi:MAG: hypothetical protein EU530_08305 [Promethearchaeota archaeon]|nr:MAG: hypothetical protein EU530_08305 [Candidatus Lokiarchaeota archaeon]
MFGRRVGITAANEYKKNTKPDKLTLNYVHNTIKALDALYLKSKNYTPILLPEYRSEIVKDRLIQLYEQLS